MNIDKNNIVHTALLEVVKDISYKKYLKYMHQNMDGFLRGGLHFVYTDEELIEYAKCANDIMYFAENYCKLLDPQTGTINNIKLRDYQREILENLNQKRFITMNISRQIGLTNVYMIYILYKMIFQTKQNFCLIANKSYESTEKLDKFRNIYLNLPWFLRKAVQVINRKNIVFDNGNRVEVSVGKNSGVGITCDFLIDDFSKMRDAEELYKNIMPVISSRQNGQLIITSTPNGSNFFYELVEKSKRSDNIQYNEYPWWIVEGRDEDWKWERIKELGGEDYFRQEYNCEFI